MKNVKSVKSVKRMKNMKSKQQEQHKKLSEMQKTMKPSEILTEAEEWAHTIEIIEPLTGKGGVANTCEEGIEEGIEVFYGNPDGSDDTVLSAEEFDKRFEITAIIDK